MPDPDHKITLGIEHKNYLNLKVNPKNPWKGNASWDSRGHTIFISPAWGLRAAILNLRTYWFSYSLHSIITILSRWAPADDTIGSLKGNPKNDPLDYANFVAERMKIDRTADLQLFHSDKTLNNVENLRNLIKAMAEMENYNGFVVPNSEFDAAVQLICDDSATPTAHAATAKTPDAKTSAMAATTVPAGGAGVASKQATIGTSGNLVADLNDDLRLRLTKLTALDLLMLLSASASTAVGGGPSTPDVRRALPVDADKAKPSIVSSGGTKLSAPTPALPEGGFALTARVLDRLMAINAFPRKADEEMIFFGLRGCLPVTVQGSSLTAAQALKVVALNYTNPRCAIGQWKLQDNTVAAFPGSTIPAIRYVEKSVHKGGAGTNQLFPGYYRFLRHIHREGTPNGHPAFIQDGNRIYLRTTDNTAYDPSDTPDTGNPGDDLHAAFGKGLDGLYSSAGCQVVMGYPHCASGYQDTPPWSIFRNNAYQLEQTLFSYILLNAADAVAVAADPDTPRPLRLRCGSHEDALPKSSGVIKEVQAALIREGFLKGEPDGNFGSASTLAVIEYQKKTFGALHADGVVGAQTAVKLNISDWPLV